MPTGARRAVGLPGTGVREVCELPCGCEELNLGPLEKQPVLLTAHLSGPAFPFLSLFSFNFTVYSSIRGERSYWFLNYTALFFREKTAVSRCLFG